MNIHQHLSWGGITSITERTTQARKAGEAACCSKRPVLRTGAGATQTAHTTLRWLFEDRFASDEGVCWARSTDKRSGYTPKQHAQLCDGFSRIDQLPTKECAGRTRLMRKRIYARTKTARTTLRLMREADIHPNDTSGNGRNGLFVSNQVLFSGPGDQIIIILH